MNKYNEKQLEENYNKFIEALKKSFDGERLEKLLHMYSMDAFNLALPTYVSKVTGLYFSFNKLLSVFAIY